MRTCEYRLSPTRAQRQQVLACLSEARALDNEMLAPLKAQYDADGTFPRKYDLTARFKGRGGEVVPATTVQTLADRLSKALTRSLQLRNMDSPCGCPRCKTPTRSLQLRNMDSPCGCPRCKTPTRWHSRPLRQYAPSREVWLDDDGKHLHVPAKCTSRPNWAGCSRSSCIARLKGRP